MSQQIQISGGAKVRDLQDVIIGTNGVLTSLGFDVANGVPKLDVNGKILVSQLPNSVMEYKGTWNAATNTPTLVNGTGNQGDVYLCNVAGTVNFGAGPIAFVVGDQVIYSGSIWQRASGATGTVTSVALTESGDSLNITGSPITTSGTINIGFNGTNLQYVNGAGNLTTFPILTGYVPYTGATQDVDLGAFSLNGKSLHIKGTAGNGHLGLKHQSAAATGIANESLIYADSLGDLGWQNANLYLSKFITSANTANRSYTFPNATGTIALTSDISYPVTSVFGRTGAVVATSGDYTTTQVTEGTNLYYTDTRARLALSFVAGSGAYNSTTGVITIPTNNNQITNGAAYITLTSLSAGTGISYNNTTGVITNSAPDQTVSLTAGAGISVSGTYPSFTIASTITQYTDALARAAISLTTTGTSGAATYNNTTGVLNIPQYTDQFVGTVTSVAALTIGTTGTDLSSSVANSTTTPVITLNVPTASATNRGALSSADWTTFNNKQNALTNPITGTGTTNYLPKFTGASTIGDSQIQDDGTSITILSRIVGINGASEAGWGLKVYENLKVQNNNGTTILQLADTATGGKSWSLISSGTGNVHSVPNGTFYLRNSSDGITALQVTASGNLGLGVTPSAWARGKALEIGTIGNSIWGDVNNEITTITSNAYLNTSDLTTGWAYGITAASARYDLIAGVHKWFNAPSGTAGNAISFTQAMTLDASGRLGIGTSSPTAKVHAVNVGNGFIYRFAGGTSSEIAGGIFASTAAGFASIGTTSNHIFNIFTNDTDRLTITSGGNVLIGSTDDGSGSKVLSYSTSAATQFKAAGTAPAITFTNTITGATIGGVLGAATAANQFITGTAAGDMVLANQFSGYRLYAVSYSGGVYLSSGATSWTANSDIRLKNINSYIENAVEKLSTLQTINFSYKDDKTNKQNLGLIAQEVEKIFPELIDKNGDGMLGVRYTELVPVLIKAIQEQQKEINELKLKIK